MKVLVRVVSPGAGSFRVVWDAEEVMIRHATWHSDNDRFFEILKVYPEGDTSWVLEHYSLSELSGLLSFWQRLFTPIAKLKRLLAKLKYGARYQ